MKCPTCKRTVADDAAVCPGCDTVLDPSLLDAAPPPDDDENTDPSTVRPRPSSGAARPSRPAPRTTSKTGAKKTGKKPGTRRPAKPAAPAPKRDWRDEISPEDWNEMPQGARAQFVPDRGLDPDDVMSEAKRFVYDLSTADKLAFFGLAVMGLACFFPWKETVAEGDVLGLLSSGVVVLVAAVISAFALAARVRRSSVNALVLWVLQLGGVGLSVVWCVIYMRLSWDSTLARSPIGNFEMWVSKPSFGVILAFFSGIVAAMGTVFGLKDTR